MSPGCEDSQLDEPARAAASAVSAPAPGSPSADLPRTPKGMVYVPPGPLVAGTPPDRLPRLADREMAGEQVILKGFFIDVFPHPNEPGGIPQTNLTQQEARELCVQQGKRLCSELEWERACKGPSNTSYEYGDEYRAEVCRTGDGTLHSPNGYSVGCRSEFGVHDLHGGSAEWTDSPFGRSARRGGNKAVAVRGGDGEHGEVVGRCADRRGVDGSQRSDAVGFRCCAGERNTLEVTLDVDDGPPLRERGIVDRRLAGILEQRLPQAVAEQMRASGVFRILRIWDWRPIGNERILISGGCAGAERTRRCGVMIARESIGKVEILAWVDSGLYPPAVRLDGSRELLGIHGGDIKSNFRRRVAYDHGRLRIGDVDRSSRR